MKNKKILDVLQLYDNGDYIPHVTLYLLKSKAHAENGFTVVPLFGQTFTLKEVVECDFILCI